MCIRGALTPEHHHGPTGFPGAGKLEGAGVTNSVSISWYLESDSNPVFHPYGPCQSNYLGPRSTSFKSVASVCLRELASAGRHVSETARGTVKRPAEHRTHPPARELEARTLLGGGGLTSHGDSGHVHSPACGLEMKILKCSELILILRVILCSVCVCMIQHPPTGFLELLKRGRPRRK